MHHSFCIVVTQHRDHGNLQEEVFIRGLSSQESTITTGDGAEASPGLGSWNC